jgi:putative endonuclease
MKNDGAAAEQQAAAYLQRNGLVLLESNFRCRFGEVDMVMKEGSTLVFVEVRKRGSQAFGGAAASITPAKQEKIIKAAQFYLQRLQAQPPCRFDAVLLDGGGQVEWIKHAFEA